MRSRNSSRKSLSLVLVMSTFCTLDCNFAKAAGGEDGLQFYEMIFGNPKQRNASRDAKTSVSRGAENCDQYGGVLGAVNSFFCHMEKDMGVTGIGSATKDFGKMKVHAEIAATSTTISGVTYDKLGQVWMCNAQSADCSNKANFNRMYYIAFSYDKDAGINKGYVISEPGNMEGQTGNAMVITYDIGSASASQTVSGTNIFTDGGSSFKMSFKGVRTASLFQLNMAAYNSTMGGFRFAMAGTPPSSSGGTNTYAMYTEGAGGSGSNGYYSLEAAGLAAPSISNGRCMSAVETGASTSTSTSTGCSSFTFGAFNYYAATGSPNVSGLTASSILASPGTSWNGMSANPSSL